MSKVTVSHAVGADLAHNDLFTITTGEITLAGANALADVVGPQTVTILANGAEYPCDATITTGGLTVQWDGGAGEVDLSAGSYYIDVDLIGPDEAGQTPMAQAAVVAPLTNSTGSTSNGTTLAAMAVTVTGVDGTGSNAASKADVEAELTVIRNNMSRLNAQIDRVITALKNAGLMATS